MARTLRAADVSLVGLTKTCFERRRKFESQLGWLLYTTRVSGGCIFGGYGSLRNAFSMIQHRHEIGGDQNHARAAGSRDAPP